MVGSHAYQAVAKREDRATIGLGGQAQYMERCRDVDGAPMSRSAAYRADRLSLVIVRMPLNSSTLVCIIFTSGHVHIFRGKFPVPIEVFVRRP